MYSNRDEWGLQDVQGTSLRQHTIRTFVWMMVGLGLSAVSATFFASSGLILRMLLNPYLPLVLLVAQLGVAIAFGARLSKMSSGGAKILFAVYALLLGITLSTLAFVYDLGSVAVAFGVTVVYFGSLVAIGITTKMNLLRFGPLLFGALLALIITEVVMMLFGVSMNTRIISAVGLLLFTGITAYDAQKMKALYHQYEGDEAMLSKLSIFSAFDLYLDFINIFLYILRFVGKRD